MAPLFFLQDPIDGSYWTLMYELFFYFIIAIMFGKSGKITIKPLMLVFLVFVLFTITNSFYPLHIKLKYISLFPHLHLFWVGVIFYKIWEYKIWEYKKVINSKIQTALYCFIYVLLFL
jgi:peptidoglycan/LPS O-acetylase OafA/YrhL